MTSLNSFCLKLNKENNINFNLNNFIDSNIFQIINYYFNNN